MKQYEVENLVFTPEAAKTLLIDGEPVHLPNKLVKLLEYMIKNAGKTIPINTILDDVWGAGQHTQNAFNVALRELHKILPSHLRIQNVHSIGYVFDYKVKETEFRFSKVEKYIANSRHFNGNIRLAFAALCIVCAFAWGYTERHYEALSNKLVYFVDNINPLFTWDYLPRTPRVSPDGKFLTYRLSIKPRSEDYLGLFDLSLGDTEPLVKMGFNDGLAWDLSGNRIVYQNRSDGNCEIRLLTFNADKSDFTTRRLTPCAKRSGRLSFAWLNDNEFFVNLTETDDITSPNGLAFHHLYSFNINKGRRELLARAIYQGGVGFFSLEYDSVTQKLYFLQSNNFQTTDVYQYHNGAVTQLHTLDYEVTYITAHNDKLIYKNNHKQFVINAPADDFANSQVLLRPQHLPIYEPHLFGDKFAYMVGSKFNFSLHRLQASKITKVGTKNIRVDALASHKGNLVFTSRQTGINQLYMQLGTGQIIKLSRMLKDEPITHVDIVGDTVAISYFERVDIYQITGERLDFVHSFAGFKHGVLNENASKILLTGQPKQSVPVIIEHNLATFIPTGIEITEAKLAFYHNHKVVYVRADNVLLKASQDGAIHQPIASDVNVRSIEYADIAGDSLFFIGVNKGDNQLYKLNLHTGAKQQLGIDNLHPTRVQKIGDAVYIRSRDNLTPELMVGHLMATL